MTGPVFSVSLGPGVFVSDVLAQDSRVDCGHITEVRQADLRNQGAQTAGALVGGLAGVATDSSQSNSNRALRAIGGAAIDGRVAGAAGASTALADRRGLPCPASSAAMA